MTEDVLAPCGLYCGVCIDNVVHRVCHGCGCDCGHCAGTAHFQNCAISRCVAGKGLTTCAECPDMPCTELILFAYHPFAIHHLPVIETLRRVQRVGAEQVLEELRVAFADEESRLPWAFLEDYGGRRRAEYAAWCAARAAKTGHAHDEQGG